MLKIKVFEAPDAEELQETINTWLEENLQIDVLHMSQSESAVADDEGDFCGNTTLSLMYRNR